MFAPSRDEARQFLAQAWARHRAAAPLTGLEQIAAGIILLHPEYHSSQAQCDHQGNQRPPQAMPLVAHPFTYMQQGAQSKPWENI